MGRQDHAPRLRSFEEEENIEWKDWERTGKKDLAITDTDSLKAELICRT